MGRPRQPPERTCVGCRVKGTKPQLIRIARARGGEPTIDPTGSSPGRGAYVHRDPSCVQKALRTGALARALRSDVGEDEARKLTELVEGKQGNA